MERSLMICFFFIGLLNAQGAWVMSNRTHPELKWKTFQTTNFNIHYHEEIQEIAIQGANMAEQMRSTLIQQVGLDTLPHLDIVFTTEDEVMNGFATPANYTVIWVDQNDVAVWLEDEKWLRTVLAHELQHLVFFSVTKTWLPFPMNNLYSGTPGWVVEGLAEYYTERWRPARFDLSHKYHVLRNTVDKIKDPHNDGFSKCLYFADRFGDSTVVKILNHRDKLGLFNFKRAFKKYTGIKLKQFEEDWRRHMNTYFFGIRSQKETYQDVGRVYRLPMRYVSGFDRFSDTLMVAMVGRKDKKQGDYSLVLAVRDTIKENKKYRRELKKKKDDTPIRIKPVWKLKELDYGRIGSDIKVSPDGSKIAYSKYRYGEHQAMIWDVYVVDVNTRKKIRITNSQRANNPSWSPDGTRLTFVAHKNSTSNLFITSLDSIGTQTRLTNYSGDVQIVTPAWSPDGSKIAYAVSKSDGNMDIVVFDIANQETIRLTTRPEVDYRPIWHPDEQKITYTSHAGMTPNFHTVDLTTKLSIQNTDIGDAIWTVGWNHNATAITGLTLNDVDSARVVDVDPARIANVSKNTMNNAFSNWRDKQPDHPLIDLDPKRDVIGAVAVEKYRFYNHLKHLGTILFPDVEGLFYNGAYIDATGRHILGALAITDWKNVSSAFEYQNATGKPLGGFWGISYFKDLFFEGRYYNRNNTYLLEFYNGFSIYGSRAFNFGKNIFANHTLRYGLNYFDRQVAYEPDSLDVFPPPESGKEGSISLVYNYLSRRPHQQNLFAPPQGHGFQIGMDLVDKKIWGDFTYNHINMDGFINQKIGPLVLFFRGRYESVWGDRIPAQETVGLVDIPNEYILGQLVLGKEHMSPRGWNGVQLGDRAFFGTTELRTPSLNFNFFEIAKVIKYGQLSGAFISDFGKVWGGDDEDWITTTGAEFRFSLLIGNTPFLIYGFGWAQAPEDWNDGKGRWVGPKPYFRMTLISPF